MIEHVTEPRLVLSEHNTNNENLMNTFINKSGASHLAFNKVSKELESDFAIINSQNILEQIEDKIQKIKLMCNFVLQDDIDNITKELKKQLLIMRNDLDELIVACDKPVIDKRLNKE